MSRERDAILRMRIRASIDEGRMTETERISGEPGRLANQREMVNDAERHLNEADRLYARGTSADCREARYHESKAGNILQSDRGYREGKNTRLIPR
jgi:hypothetical protein